MELQINWIQKKFEDLSISELYAILRLRTEVFVVEQNCVFQDMDNKDQKSEHLMGWIGNDLVAYVRILPPGLSYDEPSIGRVVSDPKYRGMGAGRALMEEAIKRTVDLYGEQPIRIGAQLYLNAFYHSLGFVNQGDIYLEDGIEHVEMIFGLTD